MEEKNLTGHRAVSRRSFLKASSLALGATALGGASLAGCAPQGEPEEGPELKSLAETAESFEPGVMPEEGTQIRTVTCMHTACSDCQYDAVVRDGCIVNIMPKPDGGLLGNRMCPKGRSGIMRVYDAERIKYPMKRAGERGSGEWERISWDEAISTIAENWKKIQSEYGTQAIITLVGMSGTAGLLNGGYGFPSRLKTILGMTTCDTCMDEAAALGTAQVFGTKTGFFDQPGESLTNLLKSKNVVAWANNVTTAYPQRTKWYLDAQKNGAKLVVVDTLYSVLASKADLWIHPKPATDDVLCLAMINVMMEEGLYDEEMCLNHTVAPCLVRSDTKRYIHMSDLGVDPIEGEPDAYGQPTFYDPPAVWDLSIDGPASVEEAVEPALNGTYTVEGIECTTAMDLIANEASQWTPEKASDICGVDADSIRELTRICADQPTAICPTYGGSAYNNGVHYARALATFAAMIGCVGREGGAFGGTVHLEHINFSCMNADFAFPMYNVPVLEFPNICKTGTYNGQPYPIKGFWVCGCNPLNAQTNNKPLLDAWLGLDFTVTIDVRFTDTAMYSDIVLPAADWFEKEDLTGNNADPIIVICEKCIEPQWESKPEGEIVRLLADAMGVGEYFEGDDDYWLNEMIGPTLKEMGITLADVREQKGIFWGERDEVLFRDRVFGTETGRARIYLEDPYARVDYGQEWDPDRHRLPKHFTASEATDDFALADTYPLVMLSPRPRLRMHGQNFSNQWLLELDPEPWVKINPSDAEERGVKDGDYVRCFNDRGEAVAKAYLSSAIMPGTLEYPHGWQRSQFKKGSFPELLINDFDPVGVNMSFFDCRAQVELWNEGE